MKKIKRFLENRKESDFVTKNSYASRTARKFIDEGGYDNETLNGFDVHCMLLVLEDPSREI